MAKQTQYDFLKVKDNTDSYYTQIPRLFDLPCRLAIIGKSFLSGKTSVIMNLLLREKYYKNYFDGEDIFIVSNNALDNKLKILMEEKDIPSVNYMSYDEGALEALYEFWEEQFIAETEDGGKPKNRILILDDVGYSGSLKDKQSGFISRMACNSRHLNVSCCLTGQKYTQISNTYRNNLTGLLLFSTTDKELQLVSEDHNYLQKKSDFFKLYRANTKERHSFFVVNYTEDMDSRYMNNNFEALEQPKYTE